MYLRMYFLFFFFALNLLYFSHLKMPFSSETPTDDLASVQPTTLTARFDIAGLPLNFKYLPARRTVLARISVSLDDLCRLQRQHAGVPMTAISVF